MRVKPLETERLRLENWHRRDAAELFDYACDPQVGPAAGWGPHKSVAESRRVIREVFRAGQVWKIVRRDSGAIIGSIGFTEDKRRPEISSRELGYSMARRHWGQGLMVEAAQAVIAYGFEHMALELISVTTGPDNHRSQRVIEKCGFHYEGLERHAYRIYDGTVRDLCCYSLLRSEWQT